MVGAFLFFIKLTNNVSGSRSRSLQGFNFNKIKTGERRIGRIEIYFRSMNCPTKYPLLGV